MTFPRSEPVLLVEDIAHVRILTLNRPDKLNAFNVELLAALADELARARDDDEIRVVLLTGAGRAFSAGADLREMEAASRQIAQGAFQAGDNPFDRLQQVAESFPKPLMAAVNGLGVGLGFTILGYCDFAFVAESARLRTPFPQLGLVSEASSSYLFPLRMGWQNAARALLMGEWFDARRLVECGLAMEITPDGQVLPAALEYARQLAAGPLQSLVATKELMLQGHRSRIAETRQLEAAAMDRLLGTPANLEALAAFSGRRSKPE